MKLINYTILSAILLIQGFGVAAIYFGGRSHQNNISLDLGGISFLVFALSLKRHAETVKYIIPLSIWTAGFYILFQNNYSTISGAILIGAAVWLDNKLEQK